MADVATGPRAPGASGLRAVAAAAQPDAFMSYAREGDDQIAYAIAEQLRAAGKEVWLDRERVSFATDWRARARAGIEASRAAIFVLNRGWLESEPCQYELAHAAQAQKRLIPLRVDPDIAAADLPPALRSVVWIPADREDVRPAISRILGALEEDIEWRDAHARYLVRALEWDEKKRNSSLLLRGAELRAAEQWLTTPGSHRETPTSAHSSYIVASRRAAGRRLRTWLALAFGALLISVALGALAYWQRGVARENEREAVAQRRVAERNARESRSRELAATASAQLRDDPELAVLIAVEAAKAAPTVQVEEVLRAALPLVSGTRRLVHSELQAFAVDQRGGVAVSGGGDGLGRTWDLRSGQRLAVLRGHSPDQQTDTTQGVLAAAAAPSGTLAATGGADGDVRVWEPRTGKLQYVLRAPAGGPGDFGVRVAFAGEHTLVTAGESGVVRTWDAATGRRRGAARLPGFKITDLAVSADGRTIAITALPDLDGEGTVAVWDAGTLTPLARVSTTASGVALDAAGGRVATGPLLPGGSAQVWDARTGTLVRSIPATSGVGAVALARDGNLVAVAQDGGEVAVVDTDTGARRATLRHPGSISTIVFNDHGSRLITAGTDRTARIWGLRSGRRLKILRGHRGPVWYAGFLPGDGRVVTAGGDGEARIWRIATDPGARELRGHAAVVDDLALTPNGRRVVTTSEDGTAAVWDIRSGRRTTRLTHHDTLVPSVAVSPDGRQILTAGTARPRVWDLARGRQLDALPDTAGAEAVFTPDGTFVVTTAGMVWEVSRSRRAGTLPETVDGPFVGGPPGRPKAVVVTIEGRAFLADLPRGRPLTRLPGSRPTYAALIASTVAIEAGNRISLHDAQTGQLIARLPGTATLPRDSIPFDSSGRYLLTIAGNRVRIWDTRRVRPLADLPHPRPLGTVNFSPDARLIVTASFDGLARVWEARTGRLVDTFKGRTSQTWNEGFIPHATFAPDNRTVVAATGGDEVFVTDCAICAPLKKLLAQATRATSRTLTADERRTLLGE